MSLSFSNQQREKRPPGSIIAGILLAGGASRRMGQTNKLLYSINGVPMVVRAANPMLAAGLSPLIAVTGFEAPKVASFLEAAGFEITHNPNHSEGMSTSLIRGLISLPRYVEGVIIQLGDMPFVTKDVFNALRTAFNPKSKDLFYVPTHNGNRGNPVLLARSVIEEVMDLSGDVGARMLLRRHSSRVKEVPVNCSGIHWDADTPKDLASTASLDLQENKHAL